MSATAKKRPGPAEARLRYGKLAIHVESESGRSMAVIRPKDPARALALALESLAKNDAALFEKIPSEVDDYTFCGYLPRTRADVPPGYIVDKDGFIIDEMQAGDSCVTFDDELSEGAL